MQNRIRNDNTYHLLDTYYVPGTIYAKFFVYLSHIILITTYSVDVPIIGPTYFIDEETEIQRGLSILLKGK